MPLSKPNRPLPSVPRKPKRIGRGLSLSVIQHAANHARYEASPYHCPDNRGITASRKKPATVCPKVWSQSDGTDALRYSIRNGYVSDKWHDAFPRYVWYRDGESTYYEARSEIGTPDRFHAYQIEANELPTGLNW